MNPGMRRRVGRQAPVVNPAANPTPALPVAPATFPKANVVAGPLDLAPPAAGLQPMGRPANPAAAQGLASALQGVGAPAGAGLSPTANPQQARADFQSALQGGASPAPAPGLQPMTGPGNPAAAAAGMQNALRAQGDAGNMAQKLAAMQPANLEQLMAGVGKDFGRLAPRGPARAIPRYRY